MKRILTLTALLSLLTAGCASRPSGAPESPQAAVAPSPNSGLATVTTITSHTKTIPARQISETNNPEENSTNAAGGTGGAGTPEGMATGAGKGPTTTARGSLFWFYVVIGLAVLFLLIWSVYHRWSARHHPASARSTRRRTTHHRTHRRTAHRTR